MMRAEVPALLQSAVQVLQRRNVTVGDLLPDANLHWAALLAHGFYDGGEREVFSFSDLGIERTDTAALQLSHIRDSGELIEGDKRLPGGLMAILRDCAGEEIWIRNGETPISINPEALAEQMLMHDSEFDFEACGTSEEWYLRFRDDDAIIFVAASEDLLEKLSRKSPETVLRISSAFVLAR